MRTDWLKKYKEEMKRLEENNAYLNASKKNQRIMESKALEYLNNHRKQANEIDKLNFDYD